MTEEEAEYWDELFTRTTPKLSGNGKCGPLTRNTDKTLLFKNPDGTVTIVPPIVNDTTTLITFDPENLVSETFKTKIYTAKRSSPKIKKNVAKKELAFA